MSADKLRNTALLLADNLDYHKDSLRLSAVVRLVLLASKPSLHEFGMRSAECGIRMSEHPKIS